MPISKFIKKIVPHYVPQVVELRDKSDESSLLSFGESPQDKALNECIKRANEFAKASQWDKSINEWQTCLKIKGDSAAVYYNIGVGYESKGDLVRAKENYQKAQELKPDEFYMKANSRIDQRLEDKKKLQVQLRKPAKPAEPYKAVAETPKPTPLPVPVAPPPKPEAASPALSILAPKDAQAAVPPPPPPIESKVESKPVVIEKPKIVFLILLKKANIRSEPNTGSKIITTMNKGEKVEKLDKSGNWFKIKLDSGINGWIFKDLVKETTVVVATKTISAEPKLSPLTTSAPSFAKSEAGEQTPKMEIRPIAEITPTKDPIKTEVASSSKKDGAALTNEEVIKLCKAGLGDEVVIAKINQAKEVDFKLDTDSLIKLKEEGVSQAVITAMLNRMKPVERQLPIPTKEGPPMMRPPMVGIGKDIQLSTKDGNINLVSIEGRMTMGGFAFIHMTYMNYPGLNAKIRTRDRRPSMLIYSESDPRANLYIVRLKQDKKEKDRDLKIGSRGSADVGLTPDKDWTIPYEGSEEKPGEWRIKLLSDLEPGEYGVYKSIFLYDFGIEK